ncbi:MAG TPA: DUF2232 domain-containing protein [Candidatus Krumholzibacteria bacterium]|nr:DUF2232 domain-containing protein [Candidatus Krumholzibacteria bacterium]
MRTWPGFLPPLFALAVTAAATAGFRAITAGIAGDGLLAAAAVLAMVFGPSMLAVVWASALIMSRPHGLAVAAALAAAGGALVLGPLAAGLPTAGAVLAGLAAGLALGARWRLDAALAVVAGLLLVTMAPDVFHTDLDAQMDEMRQSFTTVLDQATPSSEGAPGRQEALERKALVLKELDTFTVIVSNFYPILVLGHLLGMALTVLLAAWGVVRLAGWRLPSWRPPAFGQWRVPFYVVWILIAGLGLVILGHPATMAVGRNAAVFAALLLSVQGVSLQFWVSARLLSLMGRIVFWTVMGLFLTPLVLASGVLLGLADQWLDLRGLDRVPPPTGGSNSKVV